MQAIVVAGTRSGCGKTSVSLGLMAALARRGLTVAPFKVGPDFIDPGLHRAACGRDSHNLDGWMCGRSVVEHVFARHGAGADVAVVEGVMGVFDGFSGTCEAGSTAQIAKWLGVPVLLVADASSMARSAAAMVKGYAEFDPELPFLGAALNNVASKGHAGLLAEALRDAGIPLLGLLPRDESLAAPSRHLGLVTAEDGGLPQERAAALAEWVEKSLDLDALLARLPSLDLAPTDDAPPAPCTARLGVALDAAFCFYYRENLRLLEAAGLELAYFSPLADKRLPEGIGGLYLGGGYPELHGIELANNTSLRKQVKAFADKGGPIYAECGGFMYLMRSLTTPKGQHCNMAGVFDFDARLLERRAALGYREIATRHDSILGPAGTLARGHEFHYSSIGAGDYETDLLFDVSTRTGPRPFGEGFRYQNVVGSYIHLHFGSNPAIAANLAAAAQNAA